MLRSGSLLACALAICACVVSVGSASALPSDRDPTFGVGGEARLLSSEFPTLALGQVVPQADGKVVVVGSFIQSAAWNSAAWRFNADGSRDASFSGDGLSNFTMPQPSKLTAAAQQSDGKLLAAGGYGSGLGGSFMVARFNTDGSLDGAFGDVATPGRTVKACPYSGQAGAISIVPVDDGGSALLVYCQTSASTSALQVYRLDSSGHWMTSWSGDGVTTVAPGATYHYAGNMFNDGLGRLVVAGYYALPSPGHRQGMAARINISNGSFDGGFGVSGINDDITPPGAGDGIHLTGATLLPNGKIAFAGAQENEDHWMFGQLGSDGLPDPAFGGTTYTDPGEGAQRGVAIATLPSAGTVAAGYATYAGDRNSVLVAREFSGAALSSFGAFGTLIDGVAGLTDQFVSLAAAPEGRLLAVRGELHTTPSTHWDYSVIRYAGTYVAPPIAFPLTAKLLKPSKSKLRASKAKSFSGSANGTGLAGVQLAITRVDSKLLKKSRRCRWVTSSKGATKKYKAVKKKCASPAKWLTAKGTSAWSYRFSKKLSPGRYVVYVRAFGSGVETSIPAKKSLTLTK